MQSENIEPNKDLAENIRLFWDKPESIGSDVDQYEIKILYKSELHAGTFQVAPEICDGTKAEVIANRFCDIKSEDLVDPEYGYTPGDILVAQIRAHNDWGWSGFSIPNTDQNGGKVFKLNVFGLSKRKSGVASSANNSALGRKDSRTKNSKRSSGRTPFFSSLKRP